jgi:malonate-semialdehyde dehydrogenase (acetylating)/methylmalonate-semialdehyde dehydrogenase
MTETLEAPAKLKQIDHWIDGRAVPGSSGRSGAVYNPATGRQAAEVAFATEGDVDAAVQAATHAFVEWRTMSLAKRADLFFRIRELIHERKEEAARLLVAEHGKVLSDALGEVTRGLEVIEYCCGLPTLLKSEYSEQASTGIDV